VAAVGLRVAFYLIVASLLRIPTSSRSIACPEHRPKSQLILERQTLNVTFEGGNRKGNRPSREVFPPLMAVRRGILHIKEGDSRAASAKSNCKSRRLPFVVGRRRCRPLGGATAGAVANTNRVA
jgi:hypothetical protein